MKRSAMKEFEHEGLGPEVCRRLECDGQVDLPNRGGLGPRDDAVEQRTARSEVPPIDARAVEAFGIQNVVATASVHQDWGKSSLFDEGVEHQWI